MKTYMFPGQGSQKKGMGGDLFDQFEELTQRADQILGYSIKELCLEDPRNELGQTQFTQPALYVVNALSYFKRLEETGETPDFVIGHSLGEFNALMAAGCFTFESGLKLVRKRGELMSQVSGGGMAAVSNASQAQIETILTDNGLSAINLANFNTPSQIVISGLKEDIEKAAPLFTQDSMMFHPLATSGAFHSTYMEPSKKKFATYLKRFKLAEQTVPVIANVTAKPYVNDDMMQTLADQIAASVRWSDSIEYLINAAADAGDEMEFIEVGHGNVLTGLSRKIIREMKKAGRMPEPAATPKTAQTDTTPSAAPATQAAPETPPASLAPRKGDTSGDAGLTTPAPSSAPQPASFANAQAQVAAWNKANPVGTKVKSLNSTFGETYGELETRSEALVLFGHRAAVYMKSYNGYFDLNEIQTV